MNINCIIFDKVRIFKLSDNDQQNECIDEYRFCTIQFGPSFFCKDDIVELVIRPHLDPMGSASDRSGEVFLHATLLRADSMNFVFKARDGEQRDVEILCVV